MTYPAESPADDGALVAAARSGDPEAVEEFLRAQQPRLLRFGLRMCGSPEDAGDVLQDTLIAMARTLPRFRGDSSVATWMFAIARSFCIKKRRRRKGAPAAVEGLRGDEPDARPTPEDVALGSERVALLERAIRALPPASREVLLLRDAEGLSAAEVASVLGVGERAVKSRLHRARRAVRDALSPAAPAPGTACPDVVDLLSRKTEGQVTPAICARMEAHVAACPRCEALCSSFRETLALCRALPVPAAPAGVDAMFRAAARKRA